GLGLELAFPRKGGSMPEPVEFRINPGSHLMLVPPDGFAFVLGGGRALDVAEARAHECVIGFPFESETAIAETYARAIAHGATAIAPPGPQPWGYSASFRDLDGHVLLLSLRKL
ncbi:MAG TPA: VOC family protein, partial [Polyangiaceae bacterium]|nr:VOC family protein [Polyangiaceae bacterium]